MQLGDSMVTEIVALLGVAVAIIAVIVSDIRTRESLKITKKEAVNSKRATEDDMLLRIHDDFYFREKNAEIIHAIEHDEPFFKDVHPELEKGISNDELDNFLGYFELLAIHIEKT